jgi:hypothetical protein
LNDLLSQIGLLSCGIAAGSRRIADHGSLKAPRSSTAVHLRTPAVETQSYPDAGAAAVEKPSNRRSTPLDLDRRFT